MSYKALSSLHCAVTRQHLTPELRLRLLDPASPLYRQKWQSEDECRTEEPFWSIYWPGGQALARYIIDNPSIVRGRRVLDVGSGCGAASIAAALSGATSVTANDVDESAAAAAHDNADLNGVRFGVCSGDRLRGDMSQSPIHGDYDVLLMGDMLYDEEIGSKVTQLAGSFSGLTLVGDPGRWFIRRDDLPLTLACVAKYELTSSTREENYGLTAGYVYKVWKGE